VRNFCLLKRSVHFKVKSYVNGKFYFEVITITSTWLNHMWISYDFSHVKKIKLNINVLKFAKKLFT
jgi:hypothetical protein